MSLSGDITIEVQPPWLSSVTFFSPAPSKQTDRPIDPRKERTHP